MSSPVTNLKIIKRKKLLKKLHSENVNNLKLIELDKEDIDLRKYFGDDLMANLRMANYTYYTDSANKRKKNVRKRTAILYAKRIFFIFIAALIFNFGVIAFLNRGDTLPSGLSGFPMLAVLIAKDKGYRDWDKYFALMFILINLPLLIGFGFKVKKSFTILTTVFMVSQLITNAIFTSIPQVHNFIHNYINIAPGWHKLVEFLDKAGNIIGTYENSSSWPVIINGFLGSICAGTSIAIAWKNGGSTGGTDIIAYYFSTKKQKSVAGMMFTVNIIATSFFLLVFGIAARHKEAVDLGVISSSSSVESVLEQPNSIIITLKDGFTINSIKKYVSHRTIFGLREFSTILYIIFNNIVLGLMYPKYKKVTLSIATKCPDTIINYFRHIKYWHAYTIFKGISGYSQEETYFIETTLLTLETKNLISDIKVIDPKAWISIKPVEQVKGAFNTQYVEQ